MDPLLPKHVGQVINDIEAEFLRLLTGINATRSFLARKLIDRHKEQ